MKPSALVSALSLAAATLLGAAPAHAVGRLLDVQVIDRDSGHRLPVYRHNGEWWVAGRPGARYAIAVRNHGAGRVMGVMSVDGVNVVTGETASWDQAGYVLSRYQDTQIAGWRKNNSEIAAFHFTALPYSYAARTGRPDNVGVIGVAVFRERYNRPVYPRPPHYRDYPMEERQSESRGRSDAPDGAPSVQAERKSMPQLGTGHGEREASYAGNTYFERRSGQPDEVITIRYDSRDNLVAMGIIPPYPTRPGWPDAFPEAPTNQGYVPDPPRW